MRYVANTKPPDKTLDAQKQKNINFSRNFIKQKIF